MIIIGKSNGQKIRTATGPAWQGVPPGGGAKKALSRPLSSWVRAAALFDRFRVNPDYPRHEATNL